MKNKTRKKAAVILFVIALLICTACSFTEKDKAIHLNDEQAARFLENKFHEISGVESADLMTEPNGSGNGKAPGPTDITTYGTVTITKEQADNYRRQYTWEPWEQNQHPWYEEIMKKNGISPSGNWYVSEEFTKNVKTSPGSAVILLNNNCFWICYATN